MVLGDKPTNPLSCFLFEGFMEQSHRLDEDFVGKEVLGYQVQKILNVGAHWVDYEGTDPEGELVIVRILPASLVKDLVPYSKLEKTLKLQTSLDHPAIAKVKPPTAIEGGCAAVVMTGVSGEGFRSFVTKNPQVSLNDAFQFIKTALEGMSHAHQAGQVHGRLSPRHFNITNDGSALLLDFAPPWSKEMGEKDPELVYLAPEVLKGREASAQSDVYSLAMLFYEYISGALPFDIDLQNAINAEYIVKTAHETQKPKDIRTIRVDMPPHTAKAITKALSQKPEDRFQTCEEFFYGMLKATEDDEDKVTETQVVATPAPAATEAKPEKVAAADQKTTKKAEESKKPFALLGGLGGKMKGLFGKNWPSIAICIVVTGVSIMTLFRHYGAKNEDLVYRVESKILDAKLRQRGVVKTPTKVGILAIDERSLTRFGRWPFSRKYYAQAFDNLKKLGVHWIGFDAVWAEPERTFLEDVQNEFLNIDGENFEAQKLRLKEMTKVSPSDQTFVDGMKRFENIIQGYFYFGSKIEAKLNTGHRKPFQGLDLMENSTIQMILIPEGFELKNYRKLSHGYGIVGNTPLHSEASDHFAFFSNDADDDAINRWVTLVANINGQLMPSLSLKAAAEMLNAEILVEFGDRDINSIELIDRETEEAVRKIPLDTKGRGRILVNHRGPMHGFHHFSLLDAYDNSFSDKERKELKGSVLLLGATATGINDIRPNPFDPAIDGVENHAAALDNILTENYMKRTVQIINIEFGIILGIFLLFSPLLIWGRAVLSGLAVMAVLGGLYAIDQVFWFGQGTWAYLVVPCVQILSMFILCNLIKYISEEKDKKFLKEAFGSYISPELIEDMYASGEPPKLGGNSGILTAYFTDIQSFSSFSEKLTATQLVELLNEYLTAMTDILLEHKGTLDKYEGDAIIAFFGAPMELEDHADRALTVAAEMQEKLLELREKWVSEGDKWPQIVKDMRMRIGINSGEIVTGNMGSRDRMNYTMMGDSVNLAARLEEAAKQYGIFTQVSQFTKKLAVDQEKFILRELDTIRVVGKKEPVTTYDLMGVAGKTSDTCIKLRDVFHKALEHYRKMEWDSAIERFQEALELEYERFPALKGKKTNPSLVYLERCEAFKKDPPPADWDGVFTLTSK